MAVNLVIDGYNLIGVSSDAGLGDIEAGRDILLEKLKSYKKIKGARITVIFDGRFSANLARTKENRNGVEVIYSKSGEIADRILKEYSAARGPAITLVTSDRDVKTFAEGRGSVVIPSEEFLYILDMCEYEELKGVEEDDTAEKIRKGPSRRPPKKERIKLRRLKKL